MNILIVDDLKAVLDSLQNGVNWTAAGIDEVYTAGSAKEAKLVMMNFDIDILLTDIEMPEEDGISLFQWTKKMQPGIVGIFLTSHAEFEYAREAIRLGGFDYILQPARMADVESCVKRAVDEAQQNKKIKRLEKSTEALFDQRDGMLELLCERGRENRLKDCESLFKSLKESYLTDFENASFHGIRIQLVRFDTKKNRWDSGLMKLVFRNVLEELFGEVYAKATIACMDIMNYVIFIAAEKGAISEEQWKTGVEAFAGFFNNRMEFRVAVYPDLYEMTEYRDERTQAIRSSCLENQQNKPGIYWVGLQTDVVTDENAQRIRMAEDYIKANVNRAISRTEVADYLHLNEEYFSRVFKKYTGRTFKDYDIGYRMELAKKLLEQTKLPISIVASKVGYDNFSHFSKLMKKYTGFSPQEYRKSKS
ncbi:MAG: helix-turn-helix domain-containing protein [Lachnospiraceae bacterium]|nr:helix-turn-helix domain-containing protein [Lachnospiraceae bacterium]